jgi:hypothetical protein
MNKTASVLALSFIFGCLAMAPAQDKPAQGMNKPPKVLVITREFVRPGRTGAVHEKTESAFVQAFASQKWPTHYMAMDSLSGRPRSLFLTGYDSFEAMETDARAVRKNTVLSAALDKAGYNDGDLLSEMDGGTFAYREDLSLHIGEGADIPHMRYFEVSRYKIKPGHDKDWEQLVKMVMAAYDKSADVTWACYEVVYGNQGEGTFLFFTPRKTAAEIDQAFARGKDFEKAMGEDGMKQMRELSASTIDNSESNLFMLNPRMSYVEDSWVKADPEFWTIKTATPAPKKKGEAEAAKK